MKILHVIRSVDPAGGGPVEGIIRISTALRNMGHEIEVASLDLPDVPFLAEFPLKVYPLGARHSGGYGYSRAARPWLREHLRDYDGIIVNGLWQYHGFATMLEARSLGIPYFVFTHGMLDPWFKETYPLKHLKKWLYWPWAEYRVLKHAKAVLFTCEEERILARKSFWLYQARERVVSYGTAEPSGDVALQKQTFLQRYPELAGKRLFLFLSRIQEKKGCDLLIEAFAKVAPLDPALHLVMAGPDQTGWVADLKRLAVRLGIADRITWPGMLSGDVKWGAFYAAEVFVLPSHQENFGIAVAEALACGVPVLISNKVNIWREIEQDGAGLVADDTAADTERIYRDWLALDEPQRLLFSQRAKECFDQRYEIGKAARNLLDIYAAPPARPSQVSRTDG